MYVKYSTLTGKKSCLKTRKVEYTQYGAEFTCNDTWSKIIVPFEDLISISEIPDLPHIAFIPKSAWDAIKNNPELKEKNIYWHDENLYCWENDNVFLGKYLRSLNMDEEIIVNDLPLGF